MRRKPRGRPAQVSSWASEVETASTLDDRSPGAQRIGRIPLRNIWLLMLYASDIARFAGRFDALVEKDLDDLPNLVAQLLSREVERRMRRNLSRGYRHREAVLTRVRGRIDALATFSERLLDRGAVACRFDELTIDTPRNRWVRAALDRIAQSVTKRELAYCCRSLAADLARAGVSGLRPSRGDLAKEQLGRNDDADRFMLAVARLAFDLALPTEEAGTAPLAAPDREEHWVRRLFEKAVAGFYAVELMPRGWKVASGAVLHWPVTMASEGMKAILPIMKTDILLDTPAHQRIVVDTKFTAIVSRSWYREESLKSGYLYQIYAYLRSQERSDDPTSSRNHATGILLHPAIDRKIDESVTVQGHRLRFITVDLSQRPQAIRQALLAVVSEHQHGLGYVAVE
ncbi:MAG: 5-methylcytosine-specific restriction endonuclease system specificity protein McrC [Candidatus Rokubacteria bacterium]|nr:5-methylcytosine-specific restriction endonuclease system specificity protein McrC [Candidatus Rokubacteria bacterium]